MLILWLPAYPPEGFQIHNQHPIQLLEGLHLPCLPEGVDSACVLPPEGPPKVSPSMVSALPSKAAYKEIVYFNSCDAAKRIEKLDKEEDKGKNLLNDGWCATCHISLTVMQKFKWSDFTLPSSVNVHEFECVCALDSPRMCRNSEVHPLKPNISNLHGPHLI